MNTPSHFLMTAALDKALLRVPIHQQALLIGSIAPDVPLWILSIGGMVYYHFILGWSLSAAAQLMFDDLYFHNPFWLVSHNLLHAPIVLLFGLAIFWRRRCNIGSIQRYFSWFLLACLLHSFVDIFTHADDGPLLFFPLNWSYRFHSPISYWDPRYHGRAFGQFELTLNVVLLVYLLKRRICRLLQKVRQHHTANP